MYVNSYYAAKLTFCLKMNKNFSEHPQTQVTEQTWFRNYRTTYFQSVLGTLYRDRDTSWTNPAHRIEELGSKIE